jgi:hypothetical protein
MRIDVSEFSRLLLIGANAMARNKLLNASIVLDLIIKYANPLSVLAQNTMPSTCIQKELSFLCTG